MADGPSVRRIKSEKRNLSVEPAPAGMSRRRFLTFLGTGFVAYFPIDTLQGGNNSEDGLLWVNHEYINPMFWSDYSDTEGATKKTKEQITREKAGVGDSVVRVRKNGDSWKFV